MTTTATTATETTTIEAHRRPHIPAQWAAAARRMTPADLSPSFTTEATEDLSLYLIVRWADIVEAEGRTARAANIRMAWLAADMANSFLIYRSRRDPHETALVRRAWGHIAREIIAHTDGTLTKNVLPFINRVETIFGDPLTRAEA